MVSDGYSRHTPVLAGVKVLRAVFVDAALLPHLGDVVGNLANNWMWSEVGDTVDDVVKACADAVESWYSPLMVGQISYFLGSLPDGWLSLDGSTYSGDDYPELYAMLDSQFKDVPEYEFTLPVMDGLFSVGVSGSLALGDTGGESDVVLSVAELPAHDHTYIQPVLNLDLEAPGVPDILAAGVGSGTTTGATGSGDSHENMPPYIALIIGVFAGRV